MRKRKVNLYQYRKCGQARNLFFLHLLGRRSVEASASRSITSSWPQRPLPLHFTSPLCYVFARGTLISSILRYGIKGNNSHSHVTPLQLSDSFALAKWVFESLEGLREHFFNPERGKATSTSPSPGKRSSPAIPPAPYVIPMTCSPLHLLSLACSALRIVLRSFPWSSI